MIELIHIEKQFGDMKGRAGDGLLLRRIPGPGSWTRFRSEEDEVRVKNDCTAHES